MEIFTKNFVWPFLCIPRVVLFKITYFGHGTTKNSLKIIPNLKFCLLGGQNVPKEPFFKNCPSQEKHTSLCCGRNIKKNVHFGHNI